MTLRLPLLIRHFIIFLTLALLVFATDTENETNESDPITSDNDDDASCPSSKNAPIRIPDSCRLVLAPVAENDWRVYSLVDGKRGTPVLPYGDVVHQLADLENDHVQYFKTFLWPGQETGGQFEGKKRVDSLVPGLGMLARQSSTASNLLPFVPRVDEGGLTRQASPGSGSITHYHNYTMFHSKDVQAGDELVLPPLSTNQGSSNDQGKMNVEKPTMFELLQKGYCLDNLRPGKSRIKEAGRGAFASRDFKEGMVVAPVPVLPISRHVLETKKKSSQLLLNYCLGHEKSPTLLFPFGPVVNLINHYTVPNVRLQWSNNSPPTMALDESQFFMMELVATRPIPKGQEIFMDYNRAWEDAWHKHIEQWRPSDDNYTPAYVIDDTIRLLRTDAEQKEHPYPTNVQASCFYRYSDRTDDEKNQAQKDSTSDKLTSFKWKLTKGLFDLKNLRPCKVLKRNENSKGRSAYAVRIFNRPGLDEKELIPKEQLHIVTHIPRNAVRFTDKPESTDQHLPGTFRYEIGLTDDLFPHSWIE